MFTLTVSLDLRSYFARFNVDRSINIPLTENLACVADALNLLCGTIQVRGQVCRNYAYAWVTCGLAKLIWIANFIPSRRVSRNMEANYWILDLKVVLLYSWGKETWMLSRLELQNVWERWKTFTVCMARRTRWFQTHVVNRNGGNKCIDWKASFSEQVG